MQSDEILHKRAMEQGCTQFSDKIPLSKKSIRKLSETLPGSAGEILRAVRKGEIEPPVVTHEELLTTIRLYLANQLPVVADPTEDANPGSSAACECD